MSLIIKLEGPILEKDKGKDMKKWLGIIIQVVVGMIIGFFGSLYAAEKLSAKWGRLGIIWFILFVYIGTFIQINIHEFGHYIFGKILGYKLMSYRIGIFTWNYENGKMKFSIIKNNGYGGLCAMLPPQQGLEGYKELLFYAGGILLNILTGLLFIGLSFLLGISAIISSFFFILGIVGLFLGILNLISFFTENHPTDGKIIWSKILKKPFAEEMMAMNKMMSQLSAGIRPRDLNIDSSLDIDKAEMFHRVVILYKYYKALDSNNLEDMEHNARILEENIEAFPAYSLPGLYYELCFLACISGDEEKAKKYYEKAGKILERDKDVNGLRVKAYFEYYINKDHKAASTHCDNALAVANKFPIRGQALMEEDLVKALKEKIES